MVTMISMQTHCILYRNTNLGRPHLQRSWLNFGVTLQSYSTSLEQQESVRYVISIALRCDITVILLRRHILCEQIIFSYMCLLQ